MNATQKRRASAANREREREREREPLDIPYPIRLPSEVVERIDAVVRAMNRAPGANASRSSILRAIVCGGTSLAELEKAYKSK